MIRLVSHRLKYKPESQREIPRVQIRVPQVEQTEVEVAESNNIFVFVFKK